MQTAIKRKYAFVLPLPLNNPDSKAALYGIAYVLADENLNLTGEREIITCRGLDNLLPSPNYLFSQGIDPFTIKNGLSEEQFLDILSEKIFNQETTVITWSIRNLKVLEQICLRNFRKPDILKKAYCVCDVNRVLKLHEILEGGIPFYSDGLSACAAKYGYQDKISKSEHTKRLDLLIYLFRYLSQVNGPLLRFVLRSYQDRIDSLSNIIAQVKYLLEYDSLSRSIEIIRPLSLREDTLEALYYDGNDVLPKSYELTDFGILSPATVLTPQRESIVNLSLRDAVTALKEASVPQNKEKGAYQTFLGTLSEADSVHYQNSLKLKNRAFIRADNNCSESYRLYVALFSGNNYRENLSDSELHKYYRYCSVQIQSQLKQYIRELENLMATADENKTEDVSLIRKIQSYPMEL